MMALESSSKYEKKELESAHGSSVAQEIAAVVENEEKDKEKIYRPVGRRKAKSLKSRGEVMRKCLKYAAETVEAQKRRIKIL